MTKPTGWLCLANGDWLDYLRGDPDARPLMYYKGPFRPTTKLPIGSPFICCRNDESPRRIHLVAEFDGYEVLGLEIAWQRFGQRLGAATQEAWLQRKPGNKGRVSCHRLKNPVFISPTTELADTGVVLTDAASNMGRYLYEDDAKRIVSKVGASFGPHTQATEEEFIEGREFLRHHRARERNKKAIKRKKEQVLSATGKLGCEVCNFDFVAKYGTLGKHFAECHHRRPISNAPGEHKLKLSDLAIVCSNCHRMLHRPPFHPISELTSIVQLFRLIGGVA